MRQNSIVPLCDLNLIKKLSAIHSTYDSLIHYLHIWYLISLHERSFVLSLVVDLEKTMD